MQDTIVLTGGGTGGHVYPLIAVAEALKAVAPELRLVFIGTERGVETQVVPERGYELELVHIDPIRGRGVWGGVRGVARAAVSIPQALGMLRRLRPKVVFSIGGYAAGSVAVAAKLLRVPLALMEPNAVVGLANRLAAPLVSRAYTAWAESEALFPPRTVLRTGLAIRDGFSPQPYRFDPQHLRVLVLGGSQGARSLNEAVPEALAHCQTQVSVVHQAGKGNDEAVRETYRRLGTGVEVEVTPFIHDMPSALSQTDLVIGRCGAGAVAEICAIGRPSLLIPYPYASGDHQYHNAQALVRAGAAVCVRNQEATAGRLAVEINAMTNESGKLASMASRAAGFGQPFAARRVAEDLLRLGGLHLEGSEAPSSRPNGLEGSVGSREVH